MFDKHWMEAANFAMSRGVPPDETIAPDGFDQLMPCVTYNRAHGSSAPKLIILHKGQLDNLGRDWIENEILDLQPVFANEVFVVFAESMTKMVSDSSAHLRAFYERLTAMPAGNAGQKSRFCDVSNLRLALTEFSRSDAEEAIRSKTRSCYLGEGRVLCSILGGKKFFVQSSDLGFAPHLIFDGYWEFWLTSFMARTVHPGDGVLDIGANAGYYSILLADLVGENGHVTSVEPNPEMYSLLRDSMAINGYLARSSLHNIAITESESIQSAMFFIPENEPKNGRLIWGGEDHDVLRSAGCVTEVMGRALTVGEFSRLDFIKIDVEGAELIVLRSLQPIIQKFNPKIICECNFARGYSFADVYRLMSRNGELLHLDFDGILKPLTEEMVTTMRIGDDWLVYAG